MKPHEVVEKLIQHAITVGHLIGSAHAVVHERIMASGQEIPDHLLPGRAIMSLPKEIREGIKNLTSKHFQHWIK